MTWELSKVAILIFGIMLFAALWQFHEDYKSLQATDEGIQEARNIARIIDEVGSSQSEITIRYKLPDTILGEDYSIQIQSGNVIVNLGGRYLGISRKSSFASSFSGNIIRQGGATISIIKNTSNSTITIT